MASISVSQFMSAANEAKSQRGSELHRQLEAILAKEKDEGRIVSYTYKYTVGRPGCSAEQFYAPFMIQFEDGERWLIFSTSVLRDRIKMDQWDALNIKQIDSSVTKAYLVYPPDIEEKDKRAWRSKNEKYQRGEEYSEIDALIPRGELVDLIRAKFDEYYNSLYGSNDAVCESGGVARFQTITTEAGRYYDFVCRAFEKEVAVTLSDRQNLDRMKSGTGSPGQHYEQFVRMVECMNLPVKDVKEIMASSNKDAIGLLPSGGSPKTDVVVFAMLNDGTSLVRTISCKRVTRDSVTVHQYSADDFADVLDPTNEDLRKNLRFFQTAGNFRDMPAGSVEELERLIAPHVERLCHWALGGHGGPGTDIQKANYLVAYRPADNSFGVHTVKEYVGRLMSECRNKTPGTPFSWTYQGKRGNNIQLKMPVLF